MPELGELSQRVLDRDRRAIGRAISLIENDYQQSRFLVRKILAHTGKARIVGVTGPPGCGKSTLIAALTARIRARQQTVAIVAVDPTSVFTGGALLGDRVRMQELSEDQGVFIRSMATRGGAGGLARATGDAVKVLDAAGYDYVLIETAGAGQSDVEIIKLAQTIIVVSAPGLGDEVQAFKAGLMEIGDIFVVNKADRENADRNLIQIRSMISTSPTEAARRRRVLKTVATKSEGIEELLAGIDEQYKTIRLQMKASPKAEEEIAGALTEIIRSQLLPKVRDLPEYSIIIRSVTDRAMDPYDGAVKLLELARRNHII